MDTYFLAWICHGTNKVIEMEFKDKSMKYKCAECGFECSHLAEALDHREYTSDGFHINILTPENIAEWNKIHGSD